MATAGDARHPGIPYPWGYSGRKKIGDHDYPAVISAKEQDDAGKPYGLAYLNGKWSTSASDFQYLCADNVTSYKWEHAPVSQPPQDAISLWRTESNDYFAIQAEPLLQFRNERVLRESGTLTSLPGITFDRLNYFFYLCPPGGDTFRTSPPEPIRKGPQGPSDAYVGFLVRRRK